MEDQVRPMFTTPFFYGTIDYEYEIPEDGFKQGHDRIVENVIELNLPDLEEKILEKCKYLIEECGLVDQPIKMNQLWLNKYDGARPHLPFHFHQNCIWTGTWYPEDTHHTVVFQNPNAGYQNSYYPEVKEPTDFNQDNTVIANPIKGSVIIHPSWIGHAVYWNGGQASHSISFDISYTGPIGDKKYGSYNDGQK